MLGHIRVYTTLLLQVTLVAKDHDGDLERTDRNGGCRPAMAQDQESYKLFLANNWGGCSSQGNSGGLARIQNHRKEKLG